MTGPHTVVAVNYHRIGPSDPGNPLHRLHAVGLDVFAAQLAAMRQRGPIVSLDDVRGCRNLAEVNFVVTFDDVPTSALAGIDLLLGQQLPVTICPCAQLTTRGWGVRDKVYCIERHADPSLVAAAVRDVLPTAANASSFYHLTKSDEFDPELVETKLIDPLFATVAEQAAPYLGADGYLSWADLAELAANPLVTIANHTDTHANLVAVAHDRLAQEITAAHAGITDRLGLSPRYLAIPFGRMRQNLAVDCSAVVRQLGYHGVLWVGQVANLIRAPYEHQLLHLTRLHAPTDAESFPAKLDELIGRGYDAAVWQIPQRRHRDRVTIVESSDPQLCTDFEALARQGKDYTGNPAFYQHMFTTNPAKGDRPDVAAVLHEGRVEATAYNFHTLFRFGGTTVPGVYLSSWRTLPETHHTAAGRLVQAMTAREAVVGVSWPSPTAAAAFGRWHEVRLWRLGIPVTPSTGITRHRRAVQHDRYPEDLTPLADALMRDTAFSVLRNRRFYQWRHETYPLATCRYVLLYDGSEAVAFAVTLRRGDRVQIADWYATTPVTYLHLIAAVHDLAAEHGASRVELETSDAQLPGEITARFAGTDVRAGSNVYHLNPDRLAELGITDASQRWPHEGRLHETASTGDVLIR